MNRNRVSRRESVYATAVPVAWLILASIIIGGSVGLSMRDDVGPTAGVPTTPSAPCTGPCIGVLR